jgi:hypothetical protein
LKRWGKKLRNLNVAILREEVNYEGVSVIFGSARVHSNPVAQKENREKRRPIGKKL